MKREITPLRWIYRYSRKYLWAVMLLAVISAAIAGSFILLALVSSGILDIAAGAKKGNITAYCMALAGLVVLQAVLNILSSNIRVRVSGKIEMELRRGVFQAFLRKSYPDVTKLHSGEIINLLTSDIDIIVGGIVGIIPRAISIATKLAVGIVVLFCIDFAFTLFVLGIGLAVCIGSRIYSEKFRFMHKEVQESAGKVRSFLQECIENILVIKSFANEEMIQERLNAYQTENYKWKVKRNAVSNFANTMVYAAFTAGYYAALAWGAFQIADGKLTFGVLTAFLQIISQIKAPFQNMSGLIPQYYSMIGSAERLMKPESFQNEEQNSKAIPAETLYKEMQEIVFDGVSFSYEDGVVLENQSFQIRKGSLTAIIGTSGTGKSTALKLMLSLIRCEKGEIYFKTETGKIYLDAGTRNMFAYVPQGNMILSGSIRENIAFSGRDVSEENIIQAAKAACIWEYINRLPAGLDTVLKERGLGLSEGQIQRIAIARAVLSDAPILLLDECTSALDHETERAVLENLKQMKTKTIICISHKIAAIECCDQVITIERGINNQ